MTYSSPGQNNPDASTRPTPGARCPFHPHPAALSLGGICGFVGSILRDYLPGNDKPALDFGAVTHIPYSIELMTQLVSLPANPVELLKWVDTSFGPRAHFRFINNQDFFVFSDPTVVREILKRTDRGRGDQFDKSSFLSDGGGPLIGSDNMLVLSNNAWREQHDLITPLFARGEFNSPTRFNRVQSLVAAGIEDLRNRVRRGGDDGCQVDLLHETSLLGLRVTLQEILGVTLPEYEKLVAIRDASRIYHSTFPAEAATPFNVPHELLSAVSSHSHEVEKAKQTLSQFIDEVIEEGRNIISTSPSVDTLCSRMIRASEGEGAIMSLEQVHYNLMAFLFAGHESTGSSLAYAWARSALDETYRGAVRAERSSLQHSPATGVSDLLARSPFTNSLLDETLRWHPPVFSLFRVTTDHLNVMARGDAGEVRIPKGAEVILNLYNCHRDEETYGVSTTGYPADQFEPRRWLPRELEDGKPWQRPDIYSFGFGPRVCIGFHLYQTTALSALQGLVDAFDVLPQFDHPDSNSGSDFTLQRIGGLPAIVRVRN